MHHPHLFLRSSGRKAPRQGQRIKREIATERQSYLLTAEENPYSRNERSGKHRASTSSIAMTDRLLPHAFDRVRAATALFHVMFDRFHHNDRVVNDEPDREHEPEKRECIDGEAEDRKQRERAYE